MYTFDKNPMGDIHSITEQLLERCGYELIDFDVKDAIDYRRNPEEKIDENIIFDALTGVEFADGITCRVVNMTVGIYQEEEGLYISYTITKPRKEDEEMAVGDEENKSLAVSDLDDYSLASTKDFVEWFNRAVNDLAIDNLLTLLNDSDDFEDEVIGVDYD